MKHLIIIILLFTTIACKAQNPIVSLDTYRQDAPAGAYFKVLNNEFDKFVGTWNYSNGNASFTIVFQKKEMVAINSDFRDILVGEYEYVENGNTIINTIPELTSNSGNVKNRNIGGSEILQNTNKYVSGEDCLPSERRIMLYLTDPDRDYLATSIVLRYDMNSTIPEKMTATIVATSGVILPYEGAPEAVRVPYGEYLMEKQ